jgi:hypothetical protein
VATPPFDIAQTVPQDNDIISQYPPAERTFRDIVESWLTLLSDPATGLIKPTAFTIPLVITTPNAGDLLILRSTEAGAGLGPTLVLHRDSASPAINDFGPNVSFHFDNSAGVDTEMGRIDATILDPTAGAEDSALRLVVLVNGVGSAPLAVSGTSIATSVFMTTPNIRGNDDASALRFHGGPNAGGANIQLFGPSTGGFANHAYQDATVHNWRDTAGGNSMTYTPAIGHLGVSNLISCNEFRSDLFRFNDGDLNTYLQRVAEDEVRFVCGNGERVRITNTSLHVGRTTFNPAVVGAGMGIDGQGSFTVSGDTTIISNRVGAPGTLFSARNNNVSVGTLTTDGVGFSLTSASDGRLKENFRPFDSGDLIDRLTFGQFEWIKNGATGYGVIAQDVQPVLPSAIFEEDELLFADYSKFIPILGAEIKALRKRLADAGL